MWPCLIKSCFSVLMKYLVTLFNPCSCTSSYIPFRDMFDTNLHLFCPGWILLIQEIPLWHLLFWVVSQPRLVPDTAASPSKFYLNVLVSTFFSHSQFILFVTNRKLWNHTNMRKTVLNWNWTVCCIVLLWHCNTSQKSEYKQTNKKSMDYTWNL